MEELTGPNKPDKIIIHHSASLVKGYQNAMIDSWHKARKFPQSRLGYFIGYHYVIEKDGTLFQARLDDDEGAHCKGQNLMSIGICLAGNFDLEMPTWRQQQTLSQLLNEKLANFKINVKNILPHRAFSPTDCYGTNLANDWGQRIYLIYELNWIQQRLLWIKNLLEI